MTLVLIIVAVVVVAVVLFLIVAYNGLIRRRNQIENSWSQIDVQLKRRLDLIPNLVETVKGYAAHEKETLERVIQARPDLLEIESLNRCRGCQCIFGTSIELLVKLCLRRNP